MTLFQNYNPSRVRYYESTDFMSISGKPEKPRGGEGFKNSENLNSAVTQTFGEQGGLIIIDSSSLSTLPP